VVQPAAQVLTPSGVALCLRYPLRPPLQSPLLGIFLYHFGGMSAGNFCARVGFLKVTLAGKAPAKRDFLYHDGSSASH